MLLVGEMSSGFCDRDVYVSKASRTNWLYGYSAVMVIAARQVRIYNLS